MDKIIIESIEYNRFDFASNVIPAFFLQSPFHSGLHSFLKEWFSPSPVINVKTSGSTGEPKQMQVSKQKMINSAKLTCDFLELKPDDKALLCLPLDYIAGKMVVIRAITRSLNLYLSKPDGNPLAGINDISLDFAAMIPLQVYNSLNNSEEKHKLERIGNIIIGGGTIDKKLEEILSAFRNNIYSTYGMTETLSHIAMRKINGKDKNPHYQPFSSVKLSLSDDDTLIIEAPLVADNIIITNDIAEIYPDGSFALTGRKDNIINSGGIKIQPEVIENLLNPFINKPFAISSVPDEKLGETIVLVSESKIDESLFDNLPKYYKPRKIIYLDGIPMTQTGKVKRKELREIIIALQ
jgi:O-succinylbenzoic acid--CoA ligase